MGTVLPLHTNHLNMKLCQAFVTPGLFIQFSIKTHTGLYKKPSAQLVESVRRE